MYTWTLANVQGINLTEILRRLESKYGLYRIGVNQFTRTGMYWIAVGWAYESVDEEHLRETLAGLGWFEGPGIANWHSEET